MLAFPASMLPTDGGFAPMVKSLSGGQSLAGVEQVVSQFNDRWKASFVFNVNSTATVMTARAFIIAMRGRSGSVLLPVFDLSRAPWAVSAAGVVLSPATQRHRKLDGTPYADPANFNDTLISAQLAAAALLGDMLISVQMVTGSTPQPGHYFSIGTRLYMITSVSGTGPFGVGIWPSLRDDAALGAAVNFSSPACEMRFTTDAEGSATLSAMSQMRFGSITLNFDEAPPFPYARELREDGGLELRD